MLALTALFQTPLLKKGGLEVKCPISKSNMTADEACSDNTFYLIKEQEAQGPHRSPEKTVQINKHI